MVGYRGCLFRCLECVASSRQRQTRSFSQMQFLRFATPARPSRRCICINKLQGVYLCPAVGTHHPCRGVITNADSRPSRYAIEMLYRGKRDVPVSTHGFSLEFRRATVMGCAPVSRACENSNRVSVGRSSRAGTDRFLRKEKKKRREGKEGRESKRLSIRKFCGLSLES